MMRMNPFPTPHRLCYSVRARRLPFCPVLVLFFLLLGLQAHASVAVLLEQPYGGFGAWNPTGHSALYFDHICAATPTSLRPCGPGELGVVLSRYDGIGTLDWVAVPLLPYLYAVDLPTDIPAYVDRLTVLRMRDLYRREHLQSVAPDTGTGGMPRGNWYQLVGSSYNRTIYGFRINTSSDQDARIIGLFNDRPNLTHYSGAFRNCADFDRVTINRLYPHAIRRNFIGDLGITTPQSVARAITRYAHKHPETGLGIFRIAQVPGDLPRSVGVQGVTESLLRRYGLPLAILSPELTAAVFVAYVGDGRFAEPKGAPPLNFVTMQVNANPGVAAVASAPPQAAPILANSWSVDAFSPPVSDRPATVMPAFLGSGTASELLAPADCLGCLHGLTIP